MGKVNYSAFHRNTAKHLNDLASIFESNEICTDVSPLRKAAVQCRRSKDKDKYWGYDIDRLIFYVGAARHVTPKGVHDIIVALDVSVKGECGEAASTDDPLTDLTIDMTIQGRTDNNKTLICTWHLDRHIDVDTSAVPKEAHPRYHFQFGGRGMKGLSDLGDALILEPPRLAHPPLDGILAIDFVLSNFCPDKWRQLRQNNQYVNLIIEAQQLLWRPYANVITSAWNPVGEELRWLPHHIWPQLVSA
ncbi:MAG: hypothetical protein WC769_06930 [Thermodesulfovibrionales bacterium]|jgi:hypothetical protein